MLGATGLSRNAAVVVEKPFGTDLASARALNDTIHRVFDESQVFRIDHFLGKESVDNILAMRFANGLFEPVWNRDHISYVQIDVPETISIEGRADFYEKTGAFRDMIVTHLFQVLGFVAMEPPIALNAQALRDEQDQGLRGDAPDRTGERRPRPVRGIPVVARRRPRDRAPRPSWRCGPRWTTGAGPASRSSCGPASAWPSSRQMITLGFKEPTMRMFAARRAGELHGRGNELVIDFDDPGWISLSSSPRSRVRRCGSGRRR